MVSEFKSWQQRRRDSGSFQSRMVLLLLALLEFNDTKLWQASAECLGKHRQEKQNASTKHWQGKHWQVPRGNQRIPHGRMFHVVAQHG